MGLLFGTDGIRARVGDGPGELNAALARSVGFAAGQVLATQGGRALVGMDTRASGPELEAALIDGLTAAGVDVIAVGVVPTPAIAFLTLDLGADFGVMISASHNPAPDNGIKIIGANGRKVPDPVEDAIEALIADPVRAELREPGQRINGLVHIETYEASLLASVEPEALSGLKVVADCAHGAASDIAPRVLRAAGAEVIVIGASPDGRNINDGYGATHLEALQKAVVEHGAHAGVAFDGDADRCLAVDGSGAALDGDQIMLILALARRDAGMLPDKTVVATVMSNLGFARALEREGLRLVRAAVGDRHVLEAMLAGGHTLGGEQSGHFILADLATTGDGLLAALQLLAEVARSGRSLADLGAQMTRMPQILMNCRVSDRSVANSTTLAHAVAEAEADLGESGRVLVRASGTEPLIRVMVEADSQARAEAVARELAGVVQAL